MKYATSAAILGWILIQAPPVWSIDYCDTEVRTVRPGSLSPLGMTPPSDANILFDGGDLSKWQGTSGPAAWEVRDGILTVKKGSGDIATRQNFRDLQLHIEWRIPKNVTGEGQHRGNSGVFLMGRYEVQILDSYNSRTYADGQAGAVYGQVAPLVNATRPPGEWNTFDIFFTAPRFNDNGSLFTPARVTVLHNGVLIQNNAEILGATGAWGRPGYYEASAAGPIRLQDHPGHGEPISYRNIWAREINVRAPAADASHAQDPAHPGQNLIATKTLQELLEDPASRAVLMRCMPEVVPNPAVADFVGKKTLAQLKGELDITLTDARLQIIEEQLGRAQSPSQH